MKNGIPLPKFEIQNTEHAGKEVMRKLGDYEMTLTYDDKGRLVRVESVNRSGHYDASLRLSPSVPAGSFSNSFGDRDDWKNGRSVSSGSYYGWEQNDTEKIDYESWVMRALIAMCGRNVG